ncbi:flavodoxin family protein [uncultured Desulfuromusa sp.]|uniref:flavodoxin family protein n=1 Tax=uncultured Desulfuromusa sp. TaxID=219183 RepID=UPI002AA7A922|nr:flavodoxin family protein [uncultured Desulfuromusa sp.]
MKKKYSILAINGSHREGKGFSEILMNSFLKGAESAGAEFDVFYPGRMDIKSCIACHKCIVATPGKCIFKDDANEFIIRLMEADLFLVVAPVYFDTMPSDLKRLFERFLPMLSPVFEFRNGRTYHIKATKKTFNVITILLSGNPEKESLLSMESTFSRIFNNMDDNLIEQFLFPTSQMIATHPDLLSGHLDALQNAGRETVLAGKPATETVDKLNETYIYDMDADIEAKNRYFAEQVQKHCSHC